MGTLYIFFHEPLMGISWDIKKHMHTDEYHDELGHVCDHRSTNGNSPGGWA